MTEPASRVGGGGARPPRARRGRRRGTLLTRAPLIGLIGPIGCGKSTVAGWLRDRGAAIVDADELTRTLMTPGSPVSEAVLARFGSAFRRPDGSIDRTALGRFVFADPKRLAQLEAIVHPAVAGVMEAAIREADTKSPTAIVLEAIKLVEAGHAPWCDEIWLVACEPEAQLARLIGRGTRAPDARQRIAAQAPSMPVWQAAATRIIRTGGGLTDTEALVDAALREAVARRG
jgi:dephospho-CoA kinase